MAAETAVGLQRQCTQSVGESKIFLNSTDTATFIRLYQKEELLWNVNMPNHTNRQKRTESLQQISKLMGKNWSVEQVRDKIMSLRSRYSKEIVKVRISIATGANPCYQPVWRYFPLLDCFLRPFSITRKTDTPVVRAFHKRLMEGGMSSNQSHSASPVSSASCSSQNGPTHTHPHIFHSPGPGPANRYHRWQQSASPSLLTYSPANGSEDMKIIEEENLSQMMEEVAMLIDEGDNDDADSGYNGGHQEGGLAEQFVVVEMHRPGKSSVDSEGSWTSSPDNAGGGIMSTWSKDEVFSPDNEECSTEWAGSCHGNIPPDSESAPNKQPLEKPQVYAPLQDEEALQTSAGLDQTNPGTVCLHQNSSRPNHAKESAEFGKVVIKKEQLASQESPPPSLPCPEVLASTDCPAKESCVFSEAVGGSGAATWHTPLNSPHDHGAPTERGKRRQSSSYLGPKLTHEPFLKRIKQEKNWMPDAVSLQSREVCGGVSGQAVNTARQEESSLSACGLNAVHGGYASSHDIPGLQTNPYAKWNNAPSSRQHACVPPPSCELTAPRTWETGSPSSADLHSATAMPSRATHQVAEAVNWQMTGLLQTIATSLVEKCAGDASADSDLAFVNYLKAELRKLDKDLQFEVKFSIQKVIYDAQKEMNRRRTQDNNSAE